MQKLILRCRFALGDVVLLTAAVRDLHQSFPGRYLTDVRTGFADIWANNRFLSPLDEYGPGVRVIDCDMPLVERSDHAGKHALHGFIDFLSEQLLVKLRLTDFRGDIHLSDEERAINASIGPLTGLDAPYWLLNAGGKYDCTVKWWEPGRFQQVVDHFRGRIQFVQIGMTEHWHPKLSGVVDLRGRTKARDLVRLVHHADGVVCGVTALMHLAAAVPLKARRRGTRPCVVVAGGREPPHWEAYPGHQFIHTIGALSCCASGGCWKSRTKPLGDGQDAPEKLCLDVRGDLPACMDLITAEEVIRRIEMYLAGGNVPTLSADQATRATQATARLVGQEAAAVSVNFHNAPQAAKDFIARIPSYPNRFAGRGIVICGGGVRMFTNAWVCIHMLRKLGCTLPIELWHLGRAEMDSVMEDLVRSLGVTCIDATTHPAVWPAKLNGGWTLKSYAMINSAFEEVLLLDADNVPVQNPESLFESTPFKERGAILWPDVGRLPRDATAWKVFDLAYRDEPEVESGQVLVNKKRCWGPLLLCMWYNEHSAFFYQHVYGDKETIHLAFRRLDVPYAMTPHGATVRPGVLFHYDFDGARLFQHRNGDKWDLLGRNRAIPGFLHEEECRQFVRDLAQRWDGLMAWLKETQAKARPPARSGPLKLAVAMGSCAERDQMRAETLQRLASVGWPEENVLIAMEERRLATKVECLTHTAWRALRLAMDTDAEYVLYIEDDVAFNRHLLDNLRRWGPLVRGELQIGSLCNFGFRELAWDVPGCAYLIHPNKFWGCQGMLLSRQMLHHCLEHWSEGPPDFDFKLAHLAMQIQQPFFFHCPSLVLHVGQNSTLGHPFNQTADFDPAWLATAPPGFEIVAATTPRAPEPKVAVHG